MEGNNQKNGMKETKTARYTIDMERLGLVQDRLAALEGLAKFLLVPGVCDDRLAGAIQLLGMALHDANRDLEAECGRVIEHWFEGGGKSSWEAVELP